MINQTEAEHLIGLEKKRVDNQSYNFPMASEVLSVPLVCMQGRENFLLDINRGSISLKCTYQKRHSKTIILVRLDVNGPPHTNPDIESAPLPILEPYVGKRMPECHLHVCVEGFGSRWAIPIPEDNFSDTKNIFSTLDDFMDYCNVVKPPKIQKGLF